ncbi:MAG: hypothetical protein JXB85_10470 [Anaerolineales bacterium]|nr:hypothetical protein [Anaerolineales bacterium]
MKLLALEIERPGLSSTDTPPRIAAGLPGFDILPLAPYNGFARLFAE